MSIEKFIKNVIQKKTPYQFSLQLNDANFNLTKKSFEQFFFTENGNIHRNKMSDTHCLEATMTRVLTSFLHL